LIWVYAQLGGSLRRLEVSFDDATGLARARILSVRAMEIIEDGVAEPPAACRRPANPEDRHRWEQEQNISRLRPEETAVELSVESIEPGTFDVITNAGIGPLGLDFTTNDDGSPGQVCWEEWVVVT